MSQRYEIVVRQRGGDREIVFCTVNNNPESIVEAAKQKVLHIAPDGIPGGHRKITVPKYEHVYFRDTRKTT